jgi:hypothetical protein
VLDCEFKAHAFCMKGLFGGKPSEDDCLSCDQYSGRSRGLGDDITRVVKLTGLDKMTKAAGCGGCKKRRQLANKAFPRKN